MDKNILSINEIMRNNAWLDVIFSNVCHIFNKHGKNSVDMGGEEHGLYESRI